MDTVTERVQYALFKAADENPHLCKPSGGLSPSKMATAIGVTRQTISNWLTHGVDSPDKSAIEKLAELAGLRPEWIQYGKGEANYADDVDIEGVIAEVTRQVVSIEMNSPTPFTEEGRRSMIKTMVKEYLKG